MNYQKMYTNNYQIKPQIIILAAGNGSRMESSLPKVMHKVGGIPMIERVLNNAKKVTEDIILVHSSGLIPYLTPYRKICKFTLQKEQLGTAHAVQAAENLIDHSKYVIVIYGDNPLITSDIIHDLSSHLYHTEAAVCTLAFEREDPAQYGRIITDEVGNFVKITEFKDANDKEKKITLCNSGIMGFAPQILKKYLPLCLNPLILQKEFYLTRIIEICANNNEKVSYYLSPDSESVVGINTQAELRKVNKIFG